MSKENVIVKAGFWYTVTNFLSKGILFLVTPLFTRLLTQEEFGVFSNFSSWLNILMFVVTLNVDSSLISARFDFEKRLDSYVFSSLTLSTASAAVWLVVCNLFMEPISAFMQLEPAYINAMLVYLLFFPALQLYQGLERYNYRYKVSATLSLLSSFGSCLLSVVLVLLMTDRLDGRIYGHVIPNVLIGLGLYVLLAARGKRVVLRDWGYAMRVCLPYIPHLLSMTVLNSTDRVMITQMRGETETALYSVAYNVAMIITLLLNSMNGAFSPWLGEKLNGKEYGDIRRVSKVYILVFLGFSAGLMLLAPEVLYIMGGEPYMEAKPIMLPIAMGCMCQFLYTLFVNVEQFYKKTWGMALASVSAALLNLVLNYIFIPIFGYVAAAYTTLAGYLWLLLVHMLLVRRMKMQAVYSYRFIFAVLGGMAVMAAGVALLYANTIARYVCIVLYGAALLALLWKYRDTIKRLIKK